MLEYKESEVTNNLQSISLRFFKASLSKDIYQFNLLQKYIFIW